MPRHLPPLNALRAFESAARLGSFTAAADELHVTHGAISRHVRALEHWLGFALFERANRRVVLTEQGRAYVAEIGTALDRIAAATDRQRQPGPARLLRVHALDTFSMRWLIPRLSHFASLHPSIELKLTTAPNPIPAIRESFDVIIRGGPDDVADYVSRPFLSEGRIPVCSPALVERTPLRCPDDLANHTLLIPATYSRIWPDWLAAAGVPGLVPCHTLTLEHFYLTLQAALDGLGVAMGPLRLVREDVSARRLTIPFSRPVLPARSYFFYVVKHRSDDQAIRLFCDWLIEAGMQDGDLPAEPVSDWIARSKETPRRNRWT